MRGRISSVSAGQAVMLAEGWDLRSTPPHAAAEPRLLPADGWLPARAPGTVAAALRAAGAWSIDGPARRFDAEDWWWRTRFSGPKAEAGEETVLCFDGLATIAEVWLNGVSLLSSENMFVAHERRVDLASDNELVICFRSLDAALGTRRPRPRWRAPMIENQQLRWFRTTLLGRTPGWSPPAAAVGPWRPIRLERRRGLVVTDVIVAPRLQGSAGIVEASCTVRVLDGDDRGRAELVVERAGIEHRTRLGVADDDCIEGTLAGRLTVPEAALWWPHTHGDPACYRSWFEVRRGSTIERVETGPIGFRNLDVRTDAGNFAISVGGESIFCRGACWTPLDPVTLSADRAALATAIDQVVAAGMNMLRVGGTMVYETDDFYDLCDERGVLVWQDLMFANMDYPDEPAFLASVADEMRQHSSRLRGHPSVALLCGSSEGEQQAAMWGAPRALWSAPLFHELLPTLVREHCPGLFYWPSSAHGGAFPHQASVGTTSYYGVGAYLRPLEDARRSEVRFASECLAFANVPGARALPGGPSVRTHHAAWKTRTPRDLGAGWDFDDVRDHYVARLFHVDPVELRSIDHDRYLALGRVATGEVMAAVFAEWRRARSTCQGGLVWFLRDLWTSAGWGVVDAAGVPKSPYHYLRRALAPVTASISDEGVNGLFVHVINERPVPLDAALEIVLYSGGETVVGRASRTLTLRARDIVEIPILELFDGFRDLSCAYRFGPPSCDLVVASLRSGGARVADAFHFPVGMACARERDLGLTAEVAPTTDGGAMLTVAARRFAQAIAIDIEGLLPDDDHFHLAPGTARTIQLARVGSGRGQARGTIQALNATTSLSVVIPQAGAT